MFTNYGLDIIYFNKDNVQEDKFNVYQCFFMAQFMDWFETRFNMNLKL